MIPDNDPIGPAISSKRFGRGYELETETPFPFTTPQEITAAAEAFAVQIDHYDPFATQQRRAIMLALKSATAAQAMRFAEGIRIALNPWPADSRADTVLRNITRTIEGA